MFLFILLDECFRVKGRKSSWNLRIKIILVSKSSPEFKHSIESLVSLELTVIEFHFTFSAFYFFVYGFFSDTLESDAVAAKDMLAWEPDWVGKETLTYRTFEFSIHILISFPRDLYIPHFILALTASPQERAFFFFEFINCTMLFVFSIGRGIT